MVKRQVIGILMMILLISTTSTSAASGDWIPQDVDVMITEYEPYAEIIKKTWDRQSLEHIIQGKLDVPDEVINAVLAQEISDSDKVKSLHITSRENGRLDIYADISNYGGVNISGTIDSCIHEGDTSYMSYTVKYKDLEDHGGMIGWMFSHLSVSMLEKLVGHIKLSNDVITKVHGNTVRIEYQEALKKSEAAQVSIGGYRLMDVLCIHGAVPHEGYIEFETSFQMPDEIKKLLLHVLDET